MLAFGECGGLCGGTELLIVMKERSLNTSDRHQRFWRKITSMRQGELTIGAATHRTSSVPPWCASGFRCWV
jgi:hypothetical protein